MGWRSFYLASEPELPPPAVPGAAELEDKADHRMSEHTDGSGTHATHGSNPFAGFELTTRPVALLFPTEVWAAHAR